jgi:hypothetical protein
VTKTSILTALGIFAVVLLTMWALDSVEGKPIRWGVALMLGGTLAIASMVGDYWRRKKPL